MTLRLASSLQAHCIDIRFPEVDQTFLKFHFVVHVQCNKILQK